MRTAERDRYREALDDARYMIGDGHYWAAKERIDRALNPEESDSG